MRGKQTKAGRLWFEIWPAKHHITNILPHRGYRFVEISRFIFFCLVEATLINLFI